MEEKMPLIGDKFPEIEVQTTKSTKGSNSLNVI